MTLGTGKLTGSTNVTFWSSATFTANPLGSVSLTNGLMVEANNFVIPSLTNGYNCPITIYAVSATLGGNVTLSGANLLSIAGGSSQTASLTTNGYNLTVGGDLTIGAVPTPP